MYWPLLKQEDLPSPSPSGQLTQNQAFLAGRAAYLHLGPQDREIDQSGPGCSPHHTQPRFASHLEHPPRASVLPSVRWEWTHQLSNSFSCDHLRGQKTQVSSPTLKKCPSGAPWRPSPKQASHKEEEAGLPLRASHSGPPTLQNPGVGSWHGALAEGETPSQTLEVPALVFREPRFGGEPQPLPQRPWDGGGDPTAHLGIFQLRDQT